MRLFGSVCLGISVIAFAFDIYSANAGPKDLEVALSEVKQAYIADPRSPAVNEKLNEISAKYNPAGWIADMPGRNWGSPSGERLRRIEEIADVIRPYGPMLAAIAFDRKSGASNGVARNLLWYAAPMPELRTALLDQVGRTGDESIYRYLFNLGLFDAEVREQFAEGLSVEKSFADRKRRAATGAEMGLVEALPVYLEMLQQPFEPKTISFVGEVPAEDGSSVLSDYRIASTGIMYLGKTAAAALPILQQRLNEIRSAFPENFKALTGDIIGAIDVLEGRRPAQRSAAHNGRGIIDLAVSPSPIPDSSASAAPAAASGTLVLPPGVNRQ